MNWKKIPETQGWAQHLGEWAIRQRTFMPRMIDLEVSRVCNLSCPACMRRADSSLAQSRAEEPFCTLQRFREIHQQIPTLATLNFMGDGEPLMNPETNDIIEYAAKQDIHTVVTSNTTLVNPETIRHWENNKVYRVHSSVDAAQKKLYEAMRVGAEWEQTLHNLKLLGSSSIPLCINTVITQQNIAEMPEIVKLAKQVGAKEVTFLMPICTYGDDTKVRPENNSTNQNIFNESARLCKQLGVKWIFPLGLNPTWRRFSFPFIRPEITIEGDLFACCYSLGRGKVWYMGYEYEIPEDTYNMGNMFKEGFREVWYGPAYRELRQVYKDSELPRGTVMERDSLLRLTKLASTDPEAGRFEHCKYCLARWGMACS